MMLGRTSELKKLNEYYDQKGNRIVVAYGQKNIGKTHILRRFISDKSYYYYMARSASEREQLYQWGRELKEMGLPMAEYPSFTEILQALASGRKSKFVLIIDEFHHIVKSSSIFMKELIAFIHNALSELQIMVVLTSSSIGWIENSMADKIGDAADALAGLLKIKELSFDALVENYQGFRVEECIEAYAILGGTPGLWQHFDDKITIKENICKNILSKNSYLYGEGDRLVAGELRETAVYSTILAALAGGKRKLNDLYLHTGFSRAKISVYLKNLIELELVEKIYSYDTDGKEYMQKSIYRIRNHFVNFYFTYLYPNLTQLEKVLPQEFYQQYIRPTFKQYVAEYYKDVCTQHFEQMNKHGRLPILYEKKGEWVGQTGSIDIVAQDQAGNTLIGACNWGKSMMTYQDYENLLYCAKTAGIRPNYVYLYSIGRFDEKLNLEAKVKQHLKLISVDNF